MNWVQLQWYLLYLPSILAGMSVLLTYYHVIHLAGMRVGRCEGMGIEELGISHTGQSVSEVPLHFHERLLTPLFIQAIFLFDCILPPTIRLFAVYLMLDLMSLDVSIMK